MGQKFLMKKIIKLIIAEFNSTFDEKDKKSDEKFFMALNKFNKINQ